MPIGLKYNSSHLDEITTLPPSNEKFTLQEVLQIKECLELGDIENLYNEGRYYTGLKIRQTYNFKFTTSIPPVLRGIICVPRAKEDINRSQGEETKIYGNIYIKRIRLSNGIMGLLQTHAKVPQSTMKGAIKTNRNEGIRAGIKKAFHDGDLSVCINRLVEEHRDIKRIVKMAESGSFIDTFSKSHFLFDCEFVRRHFVSMGRDERMAEIERIITLPGGFRKVSKYNPDITKCEISELDMRFYKIQFAELFTYGKFTEKLFYASTIDLYDTAPLSDYISVLDRSLRNK